MRILIVKLSALGDVVHALPVLDLLRQIDAGGEIDWVVEEANRAILEGHPLIRNIIGINTRAWRKALLSADTCREVGTAINRLRKASYDAVFDLQGNIKSGIVAALTGAPKRFGFDRNGARESLNLIFTNHHVTLGPQDHHISKRSLRIISSAFETDYASFKLASHIETGPEDDHAAAELLSAAPGNLRLLFHTGTTWETKKWSIEGWLGLGRLVLERFPAASIFFSWGNEQERVEAETIVTGLGSRALLLPRLPVKVFCALLKKVDLVAGGDTGPIHIAAAVGTATVSFYRSTDASRNGPQGSRHMTLQSGLPCTICLKRSCPDDQDCRLSIRLADMFAAIVRIVAPEGSP